MNSAARSPWMLNLCRFSRTQVPVGSAPAMGDMVGIASRSGVRPASSARTARTMAWCSQGSRVLLET